MKWEYLTVRATVIHNAKISGILINNQPAKDWNDKQLYELLNDLGRQDWELVFVQKVPNEVYIFKRPTSS
jgi:hypothetical protein